MKRIRIRLRIGNAMRRHLLGPLTVLILCCLSNGAFCNELYAHIAQRLALMEEVAAYKWHHGLAIEDRAREARVVEDVSARALARYVELESGRRFFLQQVRAAKEIQNYWFTKWRDDPPPAARDLRTSLRPEISRIGNAIIDELSRVEPHNKAQFFAHMNFPGLSQATRERLYEALISVRTYPDRLAQIRATGTVRIGTTGDYQPFSYRLEADGERRGIDIDLALDFANAVSAQAIFVSTSWPTLMEDLLAGKFDLAMSGISIIPTRQTQAFFSTPYHRGGKTPIARCDNSDRFDSFDKIDQASTRLVVNPGGTNEKFIDSKIKHAQKILHNDNRTIFNEIISRRADVMVTDNIEVAVQTALYPALCATMLGKTLNVQDKGVLLPQEAALKAVVDSWLSRRIEDGTVARTINRHITSGSD